MKKSSLFLSVIVASSLSASVDVKSLDIYKNKTFVNQLVNQDSNKIKLLGNINFEDIRFISNDKCNITNTRIEKTNSIDDSFTKKLKELEKNIAFSENKIKSLEKSLELIYSIILDNNAANIENIKQVLTYSEDEIESKNNEIYAKKQNVKELKNELIKLKKERNISKYTWLHYDLVCSDNSKLLVTYPFYNLRYKSFYDINANTQEENINIKNKSFITQSSGVNLDNIDINLYSYSYFNTLKPVSYRADYLRLHQNIQNMEMMAYAAENAPVMRKSKKVKPSFSYNENQIKSFFKASNITLKAGVKTEILFSNDTYKTKNIVEIDGYGFVKGFHKIEFKSDKLYGASNTKQYLDGVFVSNSYINKIKKLQDSSIYFGQDKFIDVKKELLEDMEEDVLFSMSKSTTKKVWKYTVINSSSLEKKISLIERLPISTHEDIKVTLISNTKYTKKEDNNGKISYDFILKPNTKKIIEFGYEIKKPVK